MKRLLTIVLIIIVGWIFGLFITRADDKVNICHATGSQSNAWEAIRISINAWDAHKKHGDFFYHGTTDSKSRPTNDNWCEEQRDEPQEPPETPEPPTAPTIPSEPQPVDNTQLIGK